MALGDQAGLAAVQAAVAQIPGLEAFLGDKVNDLHAALVDTLSGAITQEGDTLLKVEQPALEQLATFNGSLSRALDILADFRAFANGFNISVTPK